MSRAEQAGIEAADWLIAQADGALSPEDRARFEAWLNASEGNKAAYWRLELGWEEAGRINALDHGRDFGQQAHHHEFRGAETKSADGQCEQGQGHGRAEPFRGERSSVPA